MEVTKWLKPSDSVSRYTVTARGAGRNASERRQVEKDNAQADAKGYRGGETLGDRAKQAHLLRRGSGDSMYTRKAYATRETPRRDQG